MQITQEKEETTFQDQESDYVLKVRNPTFPKRFEFGYAHFEARKQFPPDLKEIIGERFFEKDRILITGRLIEDYPDGLLDHQLDPRKQYVEIGAGMSEWTPRIVTAIKCEKPPIVIDPANYQVMQRMLQDALSLPLIPEAREEILEKIERIKIITNPERVKLINSRLGEAIKNHPELTGCADVLVDSCGPIMYSETELELEDIRTKSNLKTRAQQKVRSLELRLLKQDGEYFYFV